MFLMGCSIVIQVLAVDLSVLECDAVSWVSVTHLVFRVAAVVDCFTVKLEALRSIETLGNARRYCVISKFNSTAVRNSKSGIKCVPSLLLIMTCAPP
jgi:hypothetical protein